MNRITEAVRTISSRIAELDAEKVANLEETAKLDTGDWLTFGDKASRAMLAGLVSAEEAQTLHIIHSNYNRDASLAERITYLQVMGELLPRI